MTVVVKEYVIENWDNAGAFMDLMVSEVSAILILRLISIYIR